MFFFVFFGATYLFSSIAFFISFCWGGLLYEFFLFSWSGLDFSFSFFFDYVSLGFFSSVSFISGLVFLYSGFYMEGTVDMRRFMWLVFGFVFSMFLLVFSGGFFLTMVGWDGLGLVSFCLVVFYSNHSSLESGLITVFSNRVGDVFFLGCFFFLFLGSSFGLSGIGEYFLFFLFLFLGAITKSAQFPFSAWLPAAMAAPTPVSSLVHSSTLVTAGVYVLLRFFRVFFFFDFVYLKVFFLLTMLIAGACAVFEKDFKKIVAMSTLSQLGMMLFILSVGVWLLTFLHMVIHAFFKSMLFLSTGSLMSHYGGGQDSRNFGGSLYSYLSFLFFVVSCVCLGGFPFYIGFYSKDFIILSGSFFLGLSMYFLFLGGCFLTILYSFRLFLGAFSEVLKIFPSFSFGENFLFSWAVSFLFFKGWLLGGLFFWVFLFDGFVVFSGFDVLVGVILLSSGWAFRLGFSLIYRFIFYLYIIGFMRWFSTGGSSVLFGHMKFYSWDSSWLEIFGGQGLYRALSRSSLGFDFYKSVGFGILFLFSLGIFLVFLF